MPASDPRLDLVMSRDGRAARDALMAAAEAYWDIKIKGKVGEGAGTFVPHIQFHRPNGEPPYPYSLVLNRIVPTFYVRRPSDARALLTEFDGAHLNAGNEVKIPVADASVAAKIAARFLAVPGA